jgi:hypothetical protein
MGDAQAADGAMTSHGKSSGKKSFSNLGNMHIFGNRRRHGAGSTSRNRYVKSEIIWASVYLHLGGGIFTPFWFFFSFSWFWGRRSLNWKAPPRTTFSSGPEQFLAFRIILHLISIQMRSYLRLPTTWSCYKQKTYENKREKDPFVQPNHSQNAQQRPASHVMSGSLCTMDYKQVPL